MSEKFVQALHAAGILEDNINRVHRVVIDAQAGYPLLIYVERSGDEPWLNIAPLAQGVQVITDAHPEPTGR